MAASVVVATHDFAVRDVLDRFFTNRDYSVSFEQMGSKAILRLLEKPIDIFTFSDISIPKYAMS